MISQMVVRYGSMLFVLCYDCGGRYLLAHIHAAKVPMLLLLLSYSSSQRF